MSNPSGLGLVDLLKNIKKIRGIEIGCLHGENAEYLLENLPQLKLDIIDPYFEYVDWHGGLVKGDMELAIYRLNKFKKRYSMHKTTSDNAVSLFLENHYNFIFIDGLHTYDQVLMDCKNYYSKIKKGGLFSGHDYLTIPEVNAAVNEFAKHHDKKIMQTTNDVWYWFK